MKTGLRVMLAAAVLAAPLPLAAQDDAAAAIAANNEAWAEAFNAGDAASVAALYAEDAVVMAPNAEPAEGRDAIEALFAGSFEAGPGMTVSLETRTLRPEGNVVVDVGRYVMTGADGGHVDHGPYLAVWENVDGEWKLALDIWNSSMPAPSHDM